MKETIYFTGLNGIVAIAFGGIFPSGCDYPTLDSREIKVLV